MARAGDTWTHTIRFMRDVLQKTRFSLRDTPQIYPPLWVSLQQIAAELEWVQSNAKGQQKKGKARLRNFEEIRQQVRLVVALMGCKRSYSGSFTH